MSHFVSRISFVLVLIVALRSTAVADIVTGDPVADGWTYQGNSLDNGIYIRGAGNFSFDLYTKVYTVGSTGSFLSMSSPWSVGDRVLGVGGVFVPRTAASAGWPAFAGDPVNSNLDTNVRIVTKYGTSPSAWSASSVAPDAGNGNGSFSNGDGGLGSVLLTTNVGQLTPGNNGQLIQPALVNVWNGTVGSNGLVIDTEVARVAYQLGANDQLVRWETFLNTTKLSGLSPLTIPSENDRWNQAIQRNTSSTDFTDALVNSSQSASVPAPPAVFLSITGLMVLAIRRKCFKSSVVEVN
jgi:hypothetical protein